MVLQLFFFFRNSFILMFSKSSGALRHFPEPTESHIVKILEYMTSVRGYSLHGSMPNIPSASRICDTVSNIVARQLEGLISIQKFCLLP